MAKRPAPPAGKSTPAIPPDTAQAALLQAVAAVGSDPAQILPKGSDPAFVAERRVATVASAIQHDGYGFAPDDPIPLTLAEFTGLKGTGALVEVSWDDLELLEDL